MKSSFEIKDKNLIKEILDNIDYGVLALCKENIPYSVPINFVYVDGFVYFHGAKKGKKIDFFSQNSSASFCVVHDYSFIPSYFSSDEKKACPATQFFKSVIMDGKIKVVEDYDEKVKSLQKMMEKMQSEGQYMPLDSKKIYEKMINATLVYKLVPNEVKAKFKFGQNLSKERFEKVIEHLKQRDSKMDKLTLEEMLKQKG